jgi:putative membrane protein
VGGKHLRLKNQINMLITTKLPIGYILKKTWFEFVLLTAVAIGLYYYATYHRNEMPDIPISIPSFIGTAISVLLSFKLSQSYDRWWEARKVWGHIVNDSRTLVMQLLAFVDRKHMDEIRQIGLRQVAWCYSLSNSLRKLDPLEPLKPYLSDADLKEASAHRNVPLAVMQQSNLQIAGLYRKDALNIYHHKQLDGTVTRLVVSMGAAERIKGTVFPVTYRIFLRISILVFIVTFAIALDDFRIYSQVPLAVIISSIFLLLERTALQMQDPFENEPTDTAMNTISRNIEINIKQMLDEPAVPGPLEPEGFYSM